MKFISTLLLGLLFGTGIAISGMINPAKVINFFDIAGSWDPSLLFVMGGALTTTLIGYRLALKQASPIFSAKFYLPTRTDIDMKLLSGAAIFGIGWGISGFCPGGAVPALGTGKTDVLIFIAALVAGILIVRLVIQPLLSTVSTRAGKAG